MENKVRSLGNQVGHVEETFNTRFDALEADLKLILNLFLLEDSEVKFRTNLGW